MSGSNDGPRDRDAHTFAELALRHASLRMVPRKANVVMDEMIDMGRRLSASEDGRQAMDGLLSHESTQVRVMAATQALRWDNPDAVRVLEEARDDDDLGVLSIVGKYTLIEYYAGNLYASERKQGASVRFGRGGRRGSEVVRHVGESGSVGAASESAWTAVRDHLAVHVGEAFRWDMEASPGLAVVEPGEGRPFWTLMTFGMSDVAMDVGDEEVPSRLELVMFLSEDDGWGAERFTDLGSWPVRMLCEAARLPVTYGTWLGAFHGLPNGDPPQPYDASTRFSGSMLGPPLSLPEDGFRFVRPDGLEVWILGVVPLYADELALKRELPLDDLLDRIDAAGIGDVVRAGRPSFG